ncbi:lytic murein transglycosylase [Hippea alviniae]|uniref:lytic murein transglycosylase n=1 Tax=Hippea alviniae TaxID=1279027 RepID=UPI0003B387E5|nr:lytic murein transglycosylase [Hippea alviniae]
MKKVSGFVGLIVLFFSCSFSLSFAFDLQRLANDIHKKYNVPKEYALNVLKRAKTLPDVKAFVNRVANSPEKVFTFDKFVVLFVNQERVRDGVSFIKEHKKLCRMIYEKYGVKPSIIAAILSIETNFGKVKLKTDALDALYTLAQFSRRKNYFLYELENFIAYTYRHKIDPFSVKGSITGALGLPQFMPSNIDKYGVDFNNNGLNLDEVEDACASISNYLVHFGYKKDKPIAEFVKMDKKPCKSSRRIACFKFSDGRCAYYRVYSSFWALVRYNGTKNYALAAYLLSKEIDKKLSSN